MDAMWIPSIISGSGLALIFWFLRTGLSKLEKKIDNHIIAGTDSLDAMADKLLSSFHRECDIRRGGDRREIEIKFKSHCNRMDVLEKKLQEEKAAQQIFNRDITQKVNKA